MIEVEKNEKTIRKEELIGLIDDDGYVIVDVLGKGSYEKEHIKNSVSAPLELLEKGEISIPRGKKIVTYCASYTCSASSRAVQILRNSGYDAVAYEGGIDEWKKAGLSMEGNGVSG